MEDNTKLTYSNQIQCFTDDYKSLSQYRIINHETEKGKMWREEEGRMWGKGQERREPLQQADI